MKFYEQVAQAIKEEAEKLSLRHHAYHNVVASEYQRTSKRVASPPPKVVQVPEYWSKDKKFDPFYVHKHRIAIAKSISKKIADQQYAPMPAYTRDIGKPDGGKREISVYQIPDAAVSSMFYKQLLRKNRHRFSGYSYAYRDDRNAHFAIQDIAVDLSAISRIFVAEYDFSKFFDSISHDYLFDQFGENGFSISPRDNHIIRAFLRGGEKGIPQGTSISLFLANLVCWRLDREFERIGLKFARYADDTVIWSPHYSRISEAAGIISEFSRDAGVDINAQKSKGIRLLCRDDMPSEFAGRTNHVEFLGYSISIDNIGIKDKSVRKIKRQISFILYRHLIQPLSGPSLVSLQIPSSGKDVDLVSALSSIRRYLYGNLSDEYIRRFLAGSSGRIFYKGVMSFYPLISNKDQMCELDGWLVNEVWKVIRLRLRLLKKWGYTRSGVFPFNVSKRNLVRSFRSQKIGKKHLYMIPSFVVVYLALQKIVSEQGVLHLIAQEDY